MQYFSSFLSQELIIILLMGCIYFKTVLNDFVSDMSSKGIYLIDVAEEFGYCNRYSTIEQVGN